jgi:hypothetical protein
MSRKNGILGPLGVERLDQVGFCRPDSGVQGVVERTRASGLGQMEYDRWRLVIRKSGVGI